MLSRTHHGSQTARSAAIGAMVGVGMTSSADGAASRGLAVIEIEADAPVPTSTLALTTRRPSCSPPPNPLSPVAVAPTRSKPGGRYTYTIVRTVPGATPYRPPDVM